MLLEQYTCSWLLERVEVVAKGAVVELRGLVMRSLLTSMCTFPMVTPPVSGTPTHCSHVITCETPGAAKMPLQRLAISATNSNYQQRCNESAL